MTKTIECPECKRQVYALFEHKKGRIACAKCYSNLWALNEERKAAQKAQGR